MRIVSLIPSATEIVHALGLGDQLVGISHDCDFPPSVLRHPVVTRSFVPVDASSAEIDSAVRDLRSASSPGPRALYALDVEALVGVHVARDEEPGLGEAGGRSGHAPLDLLVGGMADAVGVGAMVAHDDDEPDGRILRGGREPLRVPAVLLPGPLGADLGLRWSYGSPLPYSGIAGEWNHMRYSAGLGTFVWGEDEPVSLAINDRRFPSYHRLDLGLRWRLGGPGMVWSPYVQVANAYNRRNVFWYDYDFHPPPTRSGLSQVPLVPTFGVEVSW